MSDQDALVARLGVQFHSPELLTQALTHRSYLNENADAGNRDNERLEFLGDAVLDFVVGAYLFEHYPDVNEGELTTLRAALVRTRTLAEFAQILGVGPALRLGNGEAESGGRERRANLCAAFEAIVGALYLDQGLAVVTAVVEPLLRPKLDAILAKSLHIDAKSAFQVWAQSNRGATPRYEVRHSEGPDHAKRFTVAVLLDDDVWGEGAGNSKQAASQSAARIALARARGRSGS